MPVQLKHINMKDFSGGIVDNYIEADDNHAKTIENFNITKFDKLRLRNGFKPIYNSDVFLPIGMIASLANNLVIVRGVLAYDFNESLQTLSVMSRPNAGALFTNNNNNGFRVDKILDHLIISNGEIQIPKKIYIDQGGVSRSEELGLPLMKDSTLSPLSLSSASSGANLYNYAFHYGREYTVGNVTYKVVSNIIYKSGSFPVQIDALNTSVIINVPGLDSTVDDVYLSNAFIEIYRSHNNGPFYRIDNSSMAADKVALPVRTFIDSSTDASLIASNILLYAPSSLSDGYYQPPKCKYTSTTNDIVYFANCEEYFSGASASNRVYQSIPSVINSSHPNFFTDFDSEILGIASFKVYTIVFTTNTVYRLEGNYSTSGTSGTRKIAIANGVNAINNSSIVTTQEGLMWCSDDGIYLTDGFRVANISLKIKNTYLKLVDTQLKKDKITASYDRINDRVYFTVGDNGLNNTKVLVYDINQKAFMYYVGETLHPSFLTNINDFIYYTDKDGYIYKEDKKVTYDFVKDQNVQMSLWRKNLLFKYTSTVFDMGDRFVRKLTNRLVLETSSSSDIAIGLTSINDDGKISREMKHIVSKGTWVWGDSSFVWGNPDSVWRKPKTFSSTRRFPRGSTRCRMKQISIQPTEIIRYKSDLYGQWLLLSHDASIGKVTMTIPSISILPLDIVGMNISFVTDNYIQQYIVTDRISDTILLFSAASFNTLTAGKDWVAKGFIPNQSFEVESLSIKYSLLDNIEGMYDGLSEGGNV